MKKHFGREEVFGHIWNNADADGIWKGAASLAEEFRVSAESADSVLAELCDHRLIQRIGSSDYIIENWPESDEPADEEEF